MRIVSASAPLKRAPDAEAPLETEALYGESLVVYDHSRGWAWAQLDRDRYVGYLPTEALGDPAKATHRVAALRAHAYPGPSIKLPPILALPLGARLTIVRQDGDFLATGDGIALLGPPSGRRPARRETDFVAVAERFLKGPYLWGGRTSQGIDCSGLVQTALSAAAIVSPRDSDMMEAALGKSVGLDDRRTTLARGDFAFWKGHVGFLRDSGTLLHASGWHMKVVSEPLVEARKRIAANGGGQITSVRRLRSRRR